MPVRCIMPPHWEQAGPRSRPVVTAGAATGGSSTQLTVTDTVAAELPGDNVYVNVSGEPPICVLQ